MVFLSAPDCFCDFLRMGVSGLLLGFLQGGVKNVVFRDGEFVVSLWWIDGGLW